MRVNGCQTPLTIPQVAAWLGQLLSLVWFAVVAFGFLQPGAGLEIAAIIWSIFAFIAIMCWFWCQLADPSVTDTRCFTFREHEGHYCNVCNKSVPGLDHHCQWLNTCVGSRTYMAFYFLTLTAGITFTWQIIVLALEMSVWKTSQVTNLAIQVFNGSDVGLYVVCAIGIALSLPAAGFYTSLFLLHTYLQIRSLTTYEFLVERSVAARKKREKKKKALLEKKKQQKSSAMSTTLKQTQKPAKKMEETIERQKSTEPLLSSIPRPKSSNENLADKVTSSALLSEVNKEQPSDITNLDQAPDINKEDAEVSKEDTLEGYKHEDEEGVLTNMIMEISGIPTEVLQEEIAEKDDKNEDIVQINIKENTDEVKNDNPTALNIV